MRNIPDDNLAYPSFIKLKNGNSGSAFQLNSGSHIYIVTAKHVLFDDNNNLRSNMAEIVCQTRNIDDETFRKFSIDFSILGIKNIYKHPDKDVAAFTIGIVHDAKDNSYKTENMPGVKVLSAGKSGAVSVAKETVIFLKDVLISNDVFLYGYPSSLGLRKSPQFDYNKPLLRKGIVASVNNKEGTIILDCPVYYGNSGGPVIQLRNHGTRVEHNVIGVVSQFIPYAENWVNQSNKIVHTEVSNSGYSVAIAMDYVFEMLSI